MAKAAIYFMRSRGSAPARQVGGIWVGTRFPVAKTPSRPKSE